MSFNALMENIIHMKEIVRELYVFAKQLDTMKNLETQGQYGMVAETREKRLLEEAISGLSNQLRILNNSTPQLIKDIKFFKELESGKGVKSQEKFVQLKYHPGGDKEKVSLTISDKDKKEFLENLSKSNLSVNKLKKKYSVEKNAKSEFGKPNYYAKFSNQFFRNFSNSLIAKGYFKKLNKDLREINSPFVVGTYVSMSLMSIIIMFILSLFVLLTLSFFEISLLWPNFFTFSEENPFLRFFKFLWIPVMFPIIVGVIAYFYPQGEAKTLGARINQELPFVAIHMSAIATSGIVPLNIFKIILRSSEYKYSNIEFRKLMNLVNFHGHDFVTALKKTAKSSPSVKLKNLLNGMATAITSGGDLHNFLDKHSESLLFDYKLEREKNTKNSETFMDIYISVAIAAPMIFLMLFVIMGSSGFLTAFINLEVQQVGLLIIMLLGLLNVGFLVFLKLKQPVI
ncbi:hypothetical protein HOD75_02045 [archaeon]|jgi:Flp pilus assembly protein TadB|nr:hypothetical protein [archaeon]MBT4241658.1 hypothetical protein [archaeon]MBT4418053.1 hypothetical protein [archaeon]